MNPRSGRGKRSKRGRRKYQKPSIQSAKFSERRALACAKTEVQQEEIGGCGVSYFS